MSACPWQISKALDGQDIFNLFFDVILCIENFFDKIKVSHNDPFS